VIVVAQGAIWADDDGRWSVDGIDVVVASLRARGAELIGAVERYEDSYRLCYVRGPEGIIVELAEQIGSGPDLEAVCSIPVHVECSSGVASSYRTVG